MSSQNYDPGSLMANDFVNGFLQKPVLYSLTALIMIIAWFVRENGNQSNAPELNPKGMALTANKQVADFIRRGKDILLQGRQKYQKRPFQVNTDWGKLTIIHPDYVDELRNDPRMDFITPAQDDSHAYIPGYEPFGAELALPKLINKYLTKALTKLTGPISTEAAIACESILTNSPDWHEVDPKRDILHIVSRMSSRVFMGEELCKDAEWIQASSDYTSASFATGDIIRCYPRWMRPFAHWFLPSCWDVRKKLDQARKVLQPHIERRNKIKAEALARGEPSPFDDSIEWFQKEYRKEADPVVNQISLSLVAIHTTTDLLQQTMFDLAMNPELFAPLREEVIEVLQTQGLKKTALYNLKLMDSVIKESQRLKPVLLGTFRRLATEDIRLSDGFTIKKGTKVLVDNLHMWDSSFYEDSDKYDGYRFLKMRDIPGQDKQSHLVSTSAGHLGFGHGQHSCPGRFFAANEIKIALCHLLLKYEWKLPENFKPKPIFYGMSMLPDPTATLLLRRRKEELDMKCTKKKVKCDKKLPCSRCVRLGVQCAREIVKIKHHVVQNAAEVEFLQSIISDLEVATPGSDIQSIIDKMKKRTAYLQFGEGLPDDQGASSHQDKSVQRPDNLFYDVYDPFLPTTLEHIAWDRTPGDCFPHTACACDVDRVVQMDPPFWGSSSPGEGISRHLPAHDARNLVRFHADHVAWHHNCLHSPTFQAECEQFWQTGTCTDPLWFALYLSVLSATIFAIQSSDRAKSLVGVDLNLIPSSSELFFGMIHVLYGGQFLQNTSMCTVQAIVISTEVAHTLGQSKLNARLFSSAVRIAESLGLQQIGTFTNATENTVETRIKVEVGKRVWCQMMIQDHFAIFFSNSYNISPGRVLTPPPFNSDDMDLQDMASDIPTVSSYGLALLEIAKLMPRFLDGLGGGDSPKPLNIQYQHVLTMDQQMRETVKSFPVFFLRQDLEKEARLPWLSIARKSLAITAAEKIIMIHRPFLFRSFYSPLYDHTRRTCTAAASTILREHEALIMADDISIWTHTAFCITAAVILCFAIYDSRENESSKLERDKETLLTAVKRLELRRHDVLAQRGAMLINVLLDELPRQDLANIVPRVLHLFNSLGATSTKAQETTIGFDVFQNPDFVNMHGNGDHLVHDVDIEGSESLMDFSNWFNDMFGNLH